MAPAQRLEWGVSVQPPENFLDTVKRASLTSTSSESDQAVGGHMHLATARHQSPGGKLRLSLRCHQKQRESSFFFKAEETINIKIGVLFPWLFLERSLSKRTCRHTSLKCASPRCRQCSADTGGRGHPATNPRPARLQAPVLPPHLLASGL